MNNFLNFHVQGSAAKPYLVAFRKTGNNLDAYCNCKAGQNGLYCKHRFRILDGSTEGIVSDNVDEVPRVVSWLKGTDVESAMLEVSRVEEQAKMIKSKMSEAKKQLARAMRQ